MRTTLLARRLGLDGNPLRRRIDKVAAFLAGLLVAGFLIGAPSLVVAAIGWAGPAGVTGRHATRVSRPVPVREVSRHVPVMAATAGDPVALRMNPENLPPGSALGTRPGNGPPGRFAVLAREAAAAVIFTSGLGFVLWCLACTGRWVLDRRRLAAWEKAWAEVGPQWTRRFRSRG